MKFIIAVFLLLQLPVACTLAQESSRNGAYGANSKQFNVGRFYGRVVDAKTNKGVEFATLQLFQSVPDSAAGKMKEQLVSGALTEANGDFSLENLPVLGEFMLIITALGYDSLSMKASFDINLKEVQQGNLQRAMSKTQKDLGNLRLASRAIQLDEVTVTADEPAFQLQLDKKIYNPGKDPSNEGTTADEMMKKVPGVQVDLDGNVTLRNAAPQLLVDGRPTTLSIDQIPSDVIDRIEIITNPSAQYDASGGQAGIINIIMKKSRRIGYNGSLRGGIDKRAKINFGGDLNVRQGKVNVFANGNYNQRKNYSYNSTERSNLFGEPLTNVYQVDTPVNNGESGYASAGIDYFMNNRNTLSFSSSFVRGQFTTDNVFHLTTDSLLESGMATSYSDRTTLNERNFRNVGSMVSYKHLFSAEGHELTADLNLNSIRSWSNGDYQTQYFDNEQVPVGEVQMQKQEGRTENFVITASTDYDRPVSDVMKVEAGARASVRNSTSTNDYFEYDYAAEEFVPVPDINNYQYNDQVYAAYGIFSNKVDRFQYQAGLRLESSYYTGTLLDQDTSFTNNYPFSLFPSGFLTYAIDDQSDLQLNYTRRISRPSFFQLMPYVDYSDSLNLQRGNPDLQPQFTNSLELSYEYRFSRNHSLLASGYFKNTNQLITRYQEVVYDSSLQEEVIINTYENANSSYLYGAEFTSTNSIQKWLTLSTNLNFYQSYIDGENIESGLSNSQFSWFAKVNASFKLPANFTLQLSADYQSKTSVPQGGASGFGGGGGRGMGMGGGFFGAPSASVQGYVEPLWEVDFSIRKEFLKNKNASVTLSISDIFRSEQFVSYYETEYFTQTASRIRDPQFIRLNFSYRFGKFDSSLFKRKNQNNNGEMLQDLGG